MAIGVIGGMFDLVADWLLDADPGDPAAVQRLITDLTELGAILSSKPVTTARKRLSRAEAELEKASREQRVTRLWNDYLARPVPREAAP